MRILIFLTLLLILPSVSASIIISEFLPNPVGSDEEEFIELFNPTHQTMLLEGYTLKTTKQQQSLPSNLSLLPDEYMVMYKHGSSLRLKNEGSEILQLLYNGTVIDEVNYSYSKEGLSWSRIQDTFSLTFPSPGKENEEEEELLQSTFTFEKITSEKKNIQFGEQVSLKLKIYKGETTKDTIKNCCTCALMV